MSFYGNISNAGKSNLTFDKIYSSRKQMEANIKTDGVFVNRFVLIEYDDNTFSRKRGYLSQNADNATKISAFMNGVLTDEDNLFLIYYDNGLHIPYTTGQSNLETGYGLEADELMEVVWEADNFFPKTHLYFYCTGITYKVDNIECTSFKLISTNSAPESAVSDYMLNYQLDQEWSRRSLATSKGFEELQGWDSTIWQKVIDNGGEKYIMVGSLNSKAPSFKIQPEAPSVEAIAPHFGRSNNVSYELHLQPNWGFRIKEAIPLELEDEEGNIIPSDKIYSDQEVVYNVVQYDPISHTDTTYSDEYPGAIYFNKDGFKPALRSKVTEIPTEFSLLPTGYTAKKDEQGRYEPKYVSHNHYGNDLVARPDIQELTVNLPDIGNAISDLWDLVYGEYEYDADGEIKTDEDGNPIYKTARNLEIDWVSPAELEKATGTRLVSEDLNAGGFKYNPEKTNTIAGCINSVHDLMGMIIAEDEDIHISEAEGSTIYYGDLNNNGYKSFYMRAPRTYLTPVDIADYENVVNGREYFDLIQYEPGKYHTKSGRNYYFETSLKAKKDTTYFTVTPTPIELKTWKDKEKEEEEDEPIIGPGKLQIHYYVKDENYLLDTSDTPDLTRDYFSIMPEQATYPETLGVVNNKIEIFNPKPRETHVDENTGETYYSGFVYFKYTLDEDGNKHYEDQVYEMIPQAYEYREVNGVRVPVLKFDGNGNPMWDETKKPPLDNPYPDNRDYFYVDRYSSQISTDSVTGEETSIVWYGSSAMNASNKPDDTTIVVFLPWGDDYSYYSLIGYNFYKLKNLSDYDNTEIYYTIEAYPETGFLPPEIEDDEDEPEIDPEDTELTHYYTPGKYYYKYGNNNYIFGIESEKVPDVEYFIINDENIVKETNTFYVPNEYYYEKIESNGKKVEVLDTETQMKIAGINEAGETILERKGLVYYKKEGLYVMEDTSGILSEGTVWNSGSKLPDSITIGKLYLGGPTIEEPDENGVLVTKTLTLAERAERLYQWTELTGFAKTLNTIHGLLLQINKTFLFEDDLTRDRNTIQGCLNYINDIINDFGELMPGEIAVIDEYGRIKSAQLFTTINDDSNEQGWINVSVNPSVSDTAISIRHNDAKTVTNDKILGQTTPKTLTYGDTFKLVAFGVDEKGHVPASQFTEVQMTMPSLNIEDNDTKQIVTGIAVSEDKQSLTLTRENVGNLQLVDYSLPTTTSSISATDTVNNAFGKLEYKLNILNSGETTEGSVAYQIAKMVINADDNNSIDKLNEIAAWIVSDTTGAAKMNADIKTNADNIKALSDLVGNTAVATQIANAISEALAGDTDGTLKYALASDLKALSQEVTGIDGRVEDLEDLIDAEKVAQWNAAQPNVISDWNETDATSYKFIANKPDLSDCIKTSTTFEYNDGESVINITISQLLTRIADLEARIKLLETPPAE